MVTAIVAIPTVPAVVSVMVTALRCRWHPTETNEDKNDSEHNT
jgi:hypothetical protein